MCLVGTGDSSRLSRPRKKTDSPDSRQQRSARMWWLCYALVACTGLAGGWYAWSSYREDQIRTTFAKASTCPRAGGAMSFYKDDKPGYTSPDKRKRWDVKELIRIMEDIQPDFLKQERLEAQRALKSDAPMRKSPPRRDVYSPLPRRSRLPEVFEDDGGDRTPQGAEASSGDQGISSAGGGVAGSPASPPGRFGIPDLEDPNGDDDSTDSYDDEPYQRPLSPAELSTSVQESIRQERMRELRCRKQHAAGAGVSESNRPSGGMGGSHAGAGSSSSPVGDALSPLRIRSMIQSEESMIREPVRRHREFVASQIARFDQAQKELKSKIERQREAEAKAKAAREAEAKANAAREAEAKANAAREAEAKANAAREADRRAAAEAKDKDKGEREAQVGQGETVDDSKAQIRQQIKVDWDDLLNRRRVLMRDQFDDRLKRAPTLAANLISCRDWCKVLKGILSRESGERRLAVMTKIVEQLLEYAGNPVGTNYDETVVVVIGRLIRMCGREWGKRLERMFKAAMYKKSALLRREFKTASGGDRKWRDGEMSVLRTYACSLRLDGRKFFPRDDARPDKKKVCENLRPEFEPLRGLCGGLKNAWQWLSDVMNHGISPELCEFVKEFIEYCGLDLLKRYHSQFRKLLLVLQQSLRKMRLEGDTKRLLNSVQTLLRLGLDQSEKLVGNWKDGILEYGEIQKKIKVDDAEVKNEQKGELKM